MSLSLCDVYVVLFAALAVDGSSSSCSNGVKLRVSVAGQATTGK